jgi:small subunit ribosomal protein S2
MSTVPITMRELIDAGAHFGHQTRRWHPHMKPFLYGDRNGIHIINLQYTLPRLRSACEFIQEEVAHGGKVLFVGTKRQAQDIVAQAATACGMPYVNRRWLGGMLTNFRTIRRSVERFKELTELLGDEEKSRGISKKERSGLTRECDKLRFAFEGIVNMERLPDAMFVIDIRNEAIAISEARRLGIPTVAVVDSNCDPFEIDYPVPGNDDAVRAIQLYCDKVGEAVRSGGHLFSARIEKEGRARQYEEEQPAPASGAGKRVVEITQPARRPARLERMLQQRPDGTSAEPAEGAAAGDGIPAPAAAAEPGKES